MRCKRSGRRRRSRSLPDAPRDGLLAHYELDGNLVDSSGHYKRGRIVKGDLGYGTGPVGRMGEFDGQTQVEFGDVGGFERNQPVSISFWFSPGDRQEMTVLQKFDSNGRGWKIVREESIVLPRLRRGSRVSFRLIHHWPDDAIEVRTKEPIIEDEDHAISITYDGSGVKFYLDGKPKDVEIVKNALAGSIITSAPLSTGEDFQGSLDDLRIYDRVLTANEIRELAVDQPARAVVTILPKKRDKSQKEQLRDYFLTFAASEGLRKTYAELKELRKEKEDLDWTVPNAMVMQEMDEPRATAILGRGDYRNRGEIVTPGVPAVLPAFGKDLPVNRLGLAKWLVDPANPLTARVAVNRYWQLHFGTGIVKTAEDFGSQGEPPSHPLLLDWLATEFVRHELGYQGHAAADGDVGSVPAGIACDTGIAGTRSGESVAGARAAIPIAGGNGAGQRAGGERAVSRESRWCGSDALSAEGALGRDRVRRCVFGADV